MSRVRLAIVDDSTFMRKALCRVLENEPDIDIVGSAASGEELLANINTWRPDVITLDLSMPGMGGLLTLEKIMEWKQIPVIILSTHSTKETQLTIEALHRGAVDFIDKQRYSLMDFDSLRRVLVEKIFSIAERKGEPRISDTQEALQAMMPENQLLHARQPGMPGSYAALFVAASTGGPPAVQQILEDFGTSLSVPVAVVQHMPEGFTKAFADRLNSHFPFPVKEASHAEIFRPGTVYVGPTGYHLRLKREEDKVYTLLARHPETSAHRPSADILFQSAAQVYGGRAIGVILTGMGKDGASGMANLAEAGAFTISQNEVSSVVYGMPKAAVELGVVREVLHIKRIGRRIIELLNNKQ